MNIDHTRTVDCPPLPDTLAPTRHLVVHVASAFASADLAVDVVVDVGVMVMVVAVVVVVAAMVAVVAVAAVAAVVVVVVAAAAVAPYLQNHPLPLPLDCEADVQPSTLAHARIGSIRAKCPHSHAWQKSRVLPTSLRDRLTGRVLL